MNKRIALPVFFSLLFLLGAGCTKDVNIKELINQYSVGKNVRVEDFGYMMLQGVWTIKADTTKNNLYSKEDLITTNISCDQTTALCSERRVILSKLKDKNEYDLFSYNFEYKITEWGSRVIKAKSVGTGAIDELTVDTIDEVATLTRTDNPKNTTASTSILVFELTDLPKTN